MVAITHPFVSPKFDGADGTLLQPTAWNAEHTLATGAAGGALAMGNGAVIWNAGTSFPASKATGDRYFRTDLGMEFYWDGTYWLSSSLLTVTDHQANLAATNTMYLSPGSRDIFVTTAELVAYVSGTNDGTRYYTFILNKRSVANVSTQLGGTVTTQSATASNWLPRTITVNAAVAVATYPLLDLTITKVSTPGNYYCAVSIYYRIIAT